MMDITSEIDIPSIYDESEGDVVLRTLVDFILIDSDGNQVSFDELGEGKSTAIAEGYVLEVLPPNWQLSITDMLCSFVIPSDDAYLNVMESNNISELIKPVLNRNDIKIGDNLDGYCIKTFKWYESKVVDILYTSEGVKLKMHFKGWNSKFDELIDITSDRIAPHGSEINKMEVDVVPKKRSVMVPWYKNKEIYLQVVLFIIFIEFFIMFDITG